MSFKFLIFNKLCLDCLFRTWQTPSLQPPEAHRLRHLHWQATPAAWIAHAASRNRFAIRSVGGWPSWFQIETISCNVSRIYDVSGVPCIDCLIRTNSRVHNSFRVPSGIDWAFGDWKITRRPPFIGTTKLWAFPVSLIGCHLFLSFSALSILFIIFGTRCIACFQGTTSHGHWSRSYKKT